MAPKSKKEGYIDWRNSKARAIIIGDLELGGMLEGLDSVKPEILLELYKNYMPEMFVGVVLDQFKARLADHQKQAGKGLEEAKRDQEAYNMDQLVHPHQDCNSQGELVFDLHPAKRFLQQDVAKKLYKCMSPKELQKSHPAYQAFKYKVFRRRIYQEICRQKFLNYLFIQHEKE
ncbi:hypothetical protein ACA910_012498 [Epithemia clementina (nom. ined.)]